MLLASVAIVVGLVVLVWSADRFVDGAAATASHLGMSALLIGMLIVGFGTSAPELVVSVIAAVQGNPGLALGNAYGSNISNIALILGVVALICPITISSGILRKELPILLGLTLFVGVLIFDDYLSRWDGIAMLVVFVATMGWLTRQGINGKRDAFVAEVDKEIATHPMPLKKAIFLLVVGLVLLIASSRLLVWGAVFVAQKLGISDLVIGLTVVAIGTSLPELASSLLAIRKNEHDLALGNVIGSNMFNTLAVVGLASSIHPLAIDPEVFYRDWVVMTILTLMLFLFGFGFWARGRINRWEGGVLLCSFIAYTGYLISTVIMS